MGDEEVMEKSLFVLAGGDVDVLELEGFCDGEVDFKRGDEGLGSLVVELEAFDEFDVAVGGGVCGKLAEVLEGADLSGLGEGWGNGLDFVTDDDEAIDLDV